jgi:transposase
MPSPSKDKAPPAARLQVALAMQDGTTWQEAVQLAGFPMSRATAYRLRHRMSQGGETALEDGRHGHPVKLRDQVRIWLQEQCQQAPHTASSALQIALRERFDLDVSISQINRVRAALGVSNHSMHQDQQKKREKSR